MEPTDYVKVKMIQLSKPYQNWPTHERLKHIRREALSLSLSLTLYIYKIIISFYAMIVRSTILHVA